jgi:hypothetical protein
LAFVENSELMLECYTAGAIEVDEKFRERHVDVAAVLPGTQLRSLRSLDDAR